MGEESLGHIPKGKWEFDEEVTNCFDDMLQRSIPQYELMRKGVTDIALHYIKEYTSGQVGVIDIGCSRGEAMADLVKGVPNSRFYGIEVSKPMAKVARERFRYFPNVNIINKDIREICDSIYPTTTVALSILTLQFIPIEYRQEVVQKIYDNLTPKGIFILVEKVLGNTSQLNKEFVHQYYTLKSSNGYSQEEIDRKRLSLEGVLVPTTAKWNEDLLSQAGFRQVDCFWRWMNFAGWVALKG